MGEMNIIGDLEKEVKSMGKKIEDLTEVIEKSVGINFLEEVNNITFISVQYTEGWLCHHSYYTNFLVSYRKLH